MAGNAQTRLIRGSCHCHAIRFEIDYDPERAELRRCNCSLCRRKGAIMAAVPIGRFRLLSGIDSLTLYQWNLRIARHYFCRHCGIYTHHQRRSDPLQIGVNVGCLEAVDQSEFTTDVVGDGASMSTE